MDWLIAFGKNDRAQAAEILSEFLKKNPGRTGVDTMWRLVDVMATEDAGTALNKLKEFVKRPDIFPSAKMTAVHVASALGDPELALEIFVNSVRYNDNLEAIWHPIDSPVRKLPGFKTFVQKVGLYDYWRTTGEWGDFCRPVGDDDFECD